MRVAVVVSRLMLVLACAACGGGGGEPTNPYTPNPSPGPPNPPGNPVNTDVTVQDNSYAPSNLTVPPGTTVTWTWAGSNYAAHSVTFTDGVNSSQTQSTGTHTRTFSTAGTYGYYCDVHGTSMSGTIRVQAP